MLSIYLYQEYHKELLYALYFILEYHYIDNFGISLITLCTYLSSFDTRYISLITHLSSILHSILAFLLGVFHFKIVEGIPIDDYLVRILSV